MKKFLKIGEISKFYGISTDTLRYYEKMGIVKPERNINGYRMYSMNQIWKINVITDLRKLGFPLKMIKEYLNNRSIDNTKYFILEEMSRVDKKIDEYKKIKKSLINKLENISKAENVKLNDINIEYIEKRKIYFLQKIMTKDEEIDFHLKQLQIEISPMLTLFGSNNLCASISREDFKMNNYNRYNGTFLLIKENDDHYTDHLDEGEYLTYSYKGDYEQKKDIFKILKKYIKENSLKVYDDIIEIYKIDIHETEKTEEYITQIQIPIIKK
ncbi:DNA-binding transcriptional MerR regulator [Oceanotoga teriensis]|jgi:DNA-binding transcriptional MerR regulator|uniref:DNA-binding transcriptional MerR regulator n=1 Tax=Oceanotoga teriensis TaxID=515440 RepID=A0AA45C7U5_9BACT|nr:MerR family transcriptional regulator [Oceanotoga teriensis]PWJ95660.1 DNA-binding transcriptional MerR regulator [Oceanotoga teriensis]